MARASNKDLEIIDCRGRRIGVGLGCVFDGQLRQIFWQFVKPCIEDVIQECCDKLEAALPSYAPSQRDDALLQSKFLLQGFVGRIYSRMVTLDRAMRSNGYPNSVEPYDPQSEVKSAHELIDHKLGILERHYGASNAFSDVVSGKPTLWGVSIDLRTAWEWLKNNLKLAYSAMLRRDDR